MKWLITSFDSRPALTGGIATFSFELTKALAAHPGQEVELLLPSCSGDTEFDKQQSFKTTRVNLKKNSYFSILPLSLSIKKIQKERPHDKLLNFLWLPEAVASYLSGQKSYYLIAHGVEIFESTGNIKKRLRKLFIPLKKAVFKKAKIVFVVSRFTGEWVAKECGVSPDKIHLLHPGVDLEKWTYKKRSTKSIQNFFTVTRLKDYKGIDKVIEALSLLKKSLPEKTWQYKIAGTGPDLERLQNLVKNLNLTNNVFFIGKVTDEELNECYAEADIFIMCSRADLITPNVEGFGIVFLEAAACGLPSIAGKSGGISDAVLHGETGWLVDPENSKEIYQAIKEAINNPEEVKKRGLAARLRVEQSFQWKHVAERLVKVCGHVRN
jgi:phosphatidylinositol alpha-1,6-mannosyltransferase